MMGCIGGSCRVLLAVVLLCLTEVSTAGTAAGPVETLSSDPLIALESVYTALNGIKWFNNSGWAYFSSNASRLEPPPYCLWFGVVCGEAVVGTPEAPPAVVELSLSTNNLSGSLETIEFDLLSELKTLDLSENRISGSIPTSVGLLSKAETILLTANRLGSSIPSQICGIPGLSTFHARSNNLNGTIPPCLFDLPVLEDLDLGTNALVGPIPDTVGNATHLNTLSLTSNSLTGTIPSSIGALTNLSAFWAYSNYLNGTIPSTIGLLRGLTSLLLDDNLIEGTIPEELYNLTMLSIFALDSNFIRGTLSTRIGQLKNLQLLSISDGSIGGTIPTEIGLLSKTLVNIDLGYNALQGEIPDEFYSLRLLQVVDLEFNFLQGTISPLIQYLSNLVSLHLSTNFLSGTIPHSFSKFFLLKNVDLSTNHLTGTVPPISASQAVDVSDNLLTMTVDQLLTMLGSSSGNLFHFSQNPGISGSFPSYAEFFPDSGASMELRGLASLRLRNCSISGTIPPNLFSYYFPSIQMLDLSLNPITGPLPALWLGEFRGEVLLNVTATLLHASVINDSIFVPHTSTSYGQDSFRCPQIIVPANGASIVGLSASYFDYFRCDCSPGYGGSAPDCRAINIPAASTSLALKISLPLAVVFVLSLWGWYILSKRIQRARRERKANELLADYAGAGEQSMEMSVMTDLTAQDLVIPFKDIEILRRIASGASGSVSLGVWRHTHVAVKQFFPDMNMEYSSFYVESSIQAKLRHPNVLWLLGICPDPLCTVTEFMNRGSLFHLIRECPDEVRPRCRSIIMDICKGMQYLHSKGILHRDLKSLNVLVDDRWIAKVADFGTCRVQATSTMTAGIGTVAWTAPETFSSGHYTKACDVYSFGIILWELASGGGVPYDDLSFSLDVIAAVQAGRRPRIPDTCPAALSSIMAQCWGPADQRPSFEDILKCISEIKDTIF